MTFALIARKIAGVGLGILFILSGILKTFSPDSASALIKQLLPIDPKFSFLLVGALSLIEIGIGVMLLIGRNVLVASTLSSCIFLIAIMVSGLLLSNPVPCGCFGSLVESKTDEVFLLRNLFFLGVSVFVLKTTLQAESQIQRSESHEKSNRISA